MQHITVKFNTVSQKFDVLKGAEVVASYDSYTMALFRAKWEQDGEGYGPVNMEV